MSQNVQRNARVQRTQHAKKISRETSTWSARKLRMTFSQSWRVEKALKVSQPMSHSSGPRRSK